MEVFILTTVWTVNGVISRENFTEMARVDMKRNGLGKQIQTISSTVFLGPEKFLVI
jgi:hypothetical protein